MSDIFMVTVIKDAPKSIKHKRTAEEIVNEFLYGDDSYNQDYFGIFTCIPAAIEEIHDMYPDDPRIGDMLNEGYTYDCTHTPGAWYEYVGNEIPYHIWKYVDGLVTDIYIGLWELPKSTR